MKHHKFYNKECYRDNKLLHVFCILYTHSTQYFLLPSFLSAHLCFNLIFTYLLHYNTFQFITILMHYKQTNKQTNELTSTQTHKLTDTQTNKHTN